MHSGFDSVSVVGLGYIGLPTAATIASRGINVIGVDISEKAVSAINDARAHFSEPDLDGLVHSAVTSGRLKAVTAPQPADAFIIAVPTPIQRDKSPDMSFVVAATRAVAKVLRKGDLVILESTSPVGTTEMIGNLFREERPDLMDGDKLAVSLAYCPERILPGRMVFELVENDRIVGGSTAACSARARSLYATFVRGQIYETSSAVAEMVKLIENSYRDVNIAFANEVANICDRVGIDAWEAIVLANKHPRVNILNPGPGVGGHCIAVDPWFLIDQNPEQTPLMKTARDVNDGRPAIMVGKIEAKAEELSTKRIACLGLAYKPNVDDLRESPAVEIVQDLASAGYEIFVCEPHVDSLPRSLSGQENIKLVDLETALGSGGVVCLLVGHSVFAGARKSGAADAVDCVGLWR